MNTISPETEPKLNLFEKLRNKVTANAVGVIATVGFIGFGGVAAVSFADTLSESLDMTEPTTEQSAPESDDAIDDLWIFVGSTSAAFVCFATGVVAQGVYAEQRSKANQV